MQPSPTDEQIQAAVTSGTELAAAGAAGRERHRGKRRPSRRPELVAILEQCEAAAATLRRYIGMIFAHDISFEQELAMKRAMENLDRERRKLRKMLYQHGR